jgi:hypothetical protein
MSPEPASQDARLPADAKGKAEFYAKIYENIRWQQSQQRGEILQHGKRLMRQSPTKRAYSDPVLESMPRYQVYQPAKRIKINDLEYLESKSRYKPPIVNLIALQNDRSKQVHHFRLLTDIQIGIP